MQYQSLIKKISTTILLTSAIIALDAQAAIFITPKAPSINAAAYVVLDYNSGTIIASNNVDAKRAPASLTKLMTAYVVFQLIKDGRANLDDDVKISEKAWKTGGSKSFIEVGKTIKLETLLKGMIIQSGNDAAVALAEHIAGTEGTFTAYMNEYAQQLGMLNTRFENASGLDYQDQHTSAADIAILAAATIRDLQYWPLLQLEIFLNSILGINKKNSLITISNSVIVTNSCGATTRLTALKLALPKKPDTT